MGSYTVNWRVFWWKIKNIVLNPTFLRWIWPILIFTTVTLTNIIASLEDANAPPQET